TFRVAAALHRLVSRVAETLAKKARGPALPPGDEPVVQERDRSARERLHAGELVRNPGRRAADGEQCRGRLRSLADERQVGVGPDWLRAAIQRRVDAAVAEPQSRSPPVGVHYAARHLARAIALH